MENDDDDAVGYKKPPKKHQFSKTNQPDKKRKPRRKTDFGSGMLKALTEPITITLKGVKQTMEVHEAFSKSIVHDSLKAPLPQKLKAWAVMAKYGMAELLSTRAKLDEDRAELEAERRDFERTRYMQQLLVEGSRASETQWRLQWYAAAKTLTAARDACECDGFSRELRRDIDTLCRTFVEDVRTEVQAEECMVDLRERLAELDREEAAQRREEDLDSDEFDEDDMPHVGNANGPDLDLANGQIGEEDLNPPTGGDDGEE
jgi:hypothetical protein